MLHLIRSEIETQYTLRRIYHFQQYFSRPQYVVLCNTILHSSPTETRKCIFWSILHILILKGVCTDCHNLPRAKGYSIWDPEGTASQHIHFLALSKYFLRPPKYDPLILIKYL